MNCQNIHKSTHNKRTEIVLIYKKYNQGQAQFPEYQETDTHKNTVTANCDGTSLMQSKLNISDKVYHVHLEFADTSIGMGEEIRNTLREKYLQKEIGSRQREPSAVQSSIQKREMEGKDV